MMTKNSRTILDSRKPWPFGARKVKRVSKAQQQRDMLRKHGKAPF